MLIDSPQSVANFIRRIKIKKRLVRLDALEQFLSIIIRWAKYEYGLSLETGRFQIIGEQALSTFERIFMQMNTGCIHIE